LLNLTVIVLATGQSARMKSDLPLVLHPLAGRAMVRHVVNAVRTLDPVDLVIVAGQDASLVREAAGDGITYVTQEEPLGTGYAVRQAEPLIAGRATTVLVIPGDTPLLRPETLRRFVDHHWREQAMVTALNFPEQKAVDMVISGLFCYRDQWLWPNLDHLQPDASGQVDLGGLLAVASARGDMVAIWSDSDPLEAMSIDDRLKLALGEAEMRRRINEGWMRSGVTLVHPEMTYIDADVELGSDTVIWPNTYLQGRTRIGGACTIGPGSVIRDSTIGDRCKIELSVIEQAIMEEESNIGPYGHLRKGAHLGKGVHMGNFGEVKNSYLGPGVKMGHFSYLGDATVGAEANIGAGTITCNYDGERKHRTTIGREAFIGSDSMLVAPLEIGDGAKTGAGSVVTHDVPAGGVAYGVPARVQATSTEPQPGVGTEELEEK
jgi:bifunctional UDP-N-acetylglucosamine pyrophosphorylase/glucosamine-1-phosphate N-acetyltransferase